ncbi:MAG: DUF1700 domain-containing protein [Streptococcus sp.]|nr:DUF1700 domain-containing protein [Streptococcus sp.]
MTKTEYLKELDRYLRKLPAKDSQEALDYFNEYFEERGPENEQIAIQELGTPKEAAYDLINNLISEKLLQDNRTIKSDMHSFWLAFLLFLLSPITLVSVVMIVTLFLLWFSFALSFFAIGLACFINGISFILEMFTYFNISFGATLLSLGLGLLFLGISILAMLACREITRLGFKGLVSLMNKFKKERISYEK